MISPEMKASSAEKRTRLRLPKRAAAEDISVSVTSAKAASPAKKIRAAAAPGYSPEAPLSIDEVAVGGTDTETEEVVACEGQSLSPDSKMLKASKEEEADLDGDLGMEAETDEAAEVAAVDEQSSSPQQRKATPTKKSMKNADDETSEWCFVGDPVPEAESKQRWPARYQRKNGGGRGSISGTSKNANNEEDMRARWHYLKAKVDGCVYNLYDDAYVKAGEGEDDYIGRIVEFFEGTDRQLYFTAQWFFRAKDTVIKDHADSHDCRRVFLSEEKNDNVLDCLVSKIEIVRVAPNMDLEAKEETIPPCDLYYDMSYSLAYSAFANLPPANARAGSETSSTISSEDTHNVSKGKPDSNFEASSGQKTELSLLDLYSGCGAMSTGLCLGANMSGVDLETRWAVDINRHACESLKLNHPRTEVRNEKAEDFLSLLKEWEKLCNEFSLIGTENSFGQGIESNSSDDDEKPEDLSASSRGEFEVGNLVGICFGDPHNIGKIGLKFKVRWKGYGLSEDTWEPMDGLSKCQERIENFVRNGFKRKILPLPGDVDVICGGPPCQGISGFNRFRNKNAPLEDPKNHQMVIFMDIVEYLKPKYVLMENVVDILKFAQGFLGRYALSRLVSLNYQTRLGIMAAGCYGLPQFRMRCFLWGAQPSEKLPQFPLPTHDVVVRGCTPNEFEQNIVAYDENQHRQLEKALLLGDAISDLPPVTNAENRDEMAYGQPPKTEFQRFIRLTQHELIHSSSAGEKSLPKGKLLDHMPLQLNDDDYQRVCRVPKKKGANFRDLPGVMVGLENVVEWDPSIDRVLLPSGKPLVPDYAMSFLNGKSSKPFARLWWDETVPTVVTRAEPHNQAIMHPEQDRVLTIRENARLQGFPDYYKLCGPVKERYIQVGNAVAVPVSRALGYALGLAFQGDGGDHPLFALPPKFPCLHVEQVPGVASEADETLE